MKNHFYLLAISLFFLTSCGGGETKKSENQDKQKSDVEEQIQDQTGDIENAKDCDEFLDQYEAWMDNYLDFMEDYMKSPMDSQLAEKYMKLMPEAAAWYSQWTNLYQCAAKEKYQERFDEIAEKADKRMKEMGIE